MKKWQSGETRLSVKIQVTSSKIMVIFNMHFEHIKYTGDVYNDKAI